MPGLCCQLGCFLCHCSADEGDGAVPEARSAGQLIPEYSLYLGDGAMCQMPVQVLDVAGASFRRGVEPAGYVLLRYQPFRFKPLLFDLDLSEARVLKDFS